MKLQTRREFLKSVFCGAAAAIAVPSVVKAVAQPAQPKIPELSYEQQIAKCDYEIANHIITPKAGVKELRRLKHLKIEGNGPGYRRFTVCIKKDPYFKDVIRLCSPIVFADDYPNNLDE